MGELQAVLPLLLVELLPYPANLLRRVEIQMDLTEAQFFLLFHGHYLIL